MIVTDLTYYVWGSSQLIERIDVNDEKNLIKVWVGSEDFYYIGTQDRDQYPIYTDPDLLVPDPNLNWYYDGVNFWEAISPTQSGPTGPTGSGLFIR